MGRGTPSGMCNGCAYTVGMLDSAKSMKAARRVLCRVGTSAVAGPSNAYGEIVMADPGLGWGNGRAADRRARSKTSRDKCKPDSQR